MTRHLISINDFSDEEIELALDVAEEMNAALEKEERLRTCEGKELYTVFYEPSTRTRSSFETAMHRLGGTVVSHAEVQTTSSVAKGENIIDTVRVLEKYADIIVMRHPLDGSTRLAADYSHIPIINGGDGSHEHPTQTLLDLYTIRKEKGRIKGMNVGLFGDLGQSRTVHSLAVALARFGAEITCIAPAGLELPDHVRNLLKGYRCKLTEYKSFKDVAGDSLAVHHRRGEKQYQEGFMDFLLESLDVLYFTRLQRERFASREATDMNQESLNKQLLAKSSEHAIIMHPLPRINELAYEVNQDRRAAYFQQAGYGVPVRMALITLLLGGVKSRPEKKARAIRGRRPEEVSGIACSNEHCVTNMEGYAIPRFYRDLHNPRILKCYYCDWVNEAV